MGFIPPTHRADFSALPDYADDLITFTYLKETDLKNEKGEQDFKLTPCIYDGSGNLILDMTDRGYIEMGNIGEGLAWARRPPEYHSAPAHWYVIDRTGKVVLSFSDINPSSFRFEYRDGLIYVSGNDATTTGYYDPATGKKTAPRSATLDRSKLVKGAVSEGVYCIKPAPPTQTLISALRRLAKK